MPFFDEEVRFNQGSDTGENEADSIQPIDGAEALHEDVLSRPDEILRVRTEVLRRELEQVKYFLDSDRGLLLHSTGTFTCVDMGTGYKIVPTQDLWVHVATAPGGLSGGRDRGAKLFIGGQPYAGVLGTNDLKIVASGQHTGQRGFADSTDLAVATGSSVGANDISVEIIANGALNGGLGTITATVTGGPKRKISITYGTLAGGTSIAQMITFINSDATSQGTYGLRHLIRASTTSPGTSTSVPTFGPTILQGGIDAEAHQVTVAQLASFFGAADNWLADGESLGLYFAGPVEDPPGTGGRRQSLYDLPTNRIGGSVSNVTPSVGHNLFNTGREPEKIPGSIPIGKRVGTEFVFVDGTRVPVGLLYGIALGDSSVTLAALRATVAPTGASVVGYGGSPTWHADAAGDALTSTSVEAALDEVVSDLANATASNSGARKVGAEAATGVVSTGNVAQNLAAGSVRQQLAEVLNTAGSDSVGGGVNARLSEYGHRLHGKRPLLKDFREAAPVSLTGGGAKFSQVVLNPRTDAHLITSGVQSQAHMILEPLQTSDIGGVAGSAITQNMAVTGHVSGLITRLQLVGKTTAQVTAMSQKLCGIDGGIYGVGGIVVEVNGVVQNTATDGNGYYKLYFVDKTDRYVELIRMSGDPSFNAQRANFQGADLTSATITFHLELTIGNSPGGDRIVAGLVNGALFRIGTDRVDEASAGSPFVGDIQRAPRDPDDVPIVTAELFGDELLCYEYDSFDVLVATRSTRNILVTADKQLLDGIETGSVVDATAGHHHGDKYSRIIMPALEGANNTSFLPASPFTLSTISTSSLAPTEANVDISSIYVPTGTTLKGVILTFSFSLAGDVFGTRALFFMEVGTFVGGVFRSATRLSTDFHADAGASAVYTYQVTTPVYTSGGDKRVAFYFTSTPFNIILASSSLSIQQTGSIVAY